MLGDGVCIYSFLLVAKSKWENVVTKKNQKGSQYQSLLNFNGSKPRVILWEDILDLIEENTVKNYLIHQLNRQSKKFKVSINDGWFRPY